MISYVRTFICGIRRTAGVHLNSSYTYVTPLHVCLRVFVFYLCSRCVWLVSSTCDFSVILIYFFHSLHFISVYCLLLLFMVFILEFLGDVRVFSDGMVAAIWGKFHLKPPLRCESDQA